MPTGASPTYYQHEHLCPTSSAGKNIVLFNFNNLIIYFLIRRTGSLNSSKQAHSNAVAWRKPITNYISCVPKIGFLLGHIHMKSSTFKQSFHNPTVLYCTLKCRDHFFISDFAAR